MRRSSQAVLAWLLALTLAFSALPIAAFAEAALSDSSSRAGGDVWLPEMSENGTYAVTLTADTTLTEMLKIPKGATLTLDLAGFALNLCKDTENKSTGLLGPGMLVINDSSPSRTGRIVPAAACGFLVLDGILIINGGTWEILPGSGSSLSNGTSITEDLSSPDWDSPKLIINGGNFPGEVRAYELDISGGNFEENVIGNTVKISGGTFHDFINLYVDYTAETIRITGGNFYYNPMTISNSGQVSVLHIMDAVDTDSCTVQVKKIENKDFFVVSPSPSGTSMPEGPSITYVPRDGAAIVTITPAESYSGDVYYSEGLSVDFLLYTRFERPFSVYTSVWINAFTMDSNGYISKLSDTILPSIPAGQTPLSEAMFTVDTSAAAYTGQPIAGRVSSASLREGTDYTVSYSNNTDVGTATVTVTGAGSYTGTLTYTFPITKADLPAETARQTVKKQVPMAEATTGNRVDIGALLPENRGETTYTAVSGGNIYLQNVQVGADGILTYDTAPAAAPTTVTITVTAEMARYSDAVVEISVELVDGIPIEITGVQAADASYNGSAHAGYTGTPAAAGYSGGFTYTYAGQDAAVLTAAPVDAGSYTVTIRPDTDGYLGERVLSFTVRKAVITGTPTCDTVQSAVGLRSVGLYPPAGGFRLGNTGAVVDGQLTWVEDRTIEQGTAFGWVFTPTGTVSNYEQKSGFLIPWPAAVNPSRPSGGSGSSGKPQETTTTTNADGSITRTVTDKATGTITETTTEKNGTKTVVETKVDGTVTTTVSIGERAGSRVVLPVETPRDSTVKITGVRKPTYVRIPVQRMTGGTVAVLVSGGAERILPAAVSSGEGLTLRIDSGVTLRITDNSKVFQDVPGGHWAQDAVNFVSSRELFNGTAPAVFTPAAPMTRQMLMTVLARLDGEDTSGDAYGKGMAWAVGKGISDGSNPTGTISREQLAAMLYRYAGASAVQGDLSRFTDSEKVSGYAVDAVRWAVEQGILTGKAGDLLDPAGPATRAEVATMLYRYILSMY